MAAILGLDEERIISLCVDVAGRGVVAAANFNSPGQTVIAGDADAVERAMAACKEAGAKRALPIKVSVPSHCALMQPAATALARDLEALAFRGAQFPVVQNVNAEVATSPESIKQNLIDQLHQPVRWVDCVRLIHQSGIGQLVECGPGKVLSGLITRIESTLLCHSSEDPANFQQALEAVTG